MYFIIRLVSQKKKKMINRLKNLSHYITRHAFPIFANQTDRGLGDPVLAPLPVKNAIFEEMPGKR